MSFPSSRILPSSGFSKPAIILKSVDLPHPEDPRRLNISDFAIFRLTLSKATTLSNLFDTSMICKKGSDIKKIVKSATKVKVALLFNYWEALKLLNTLEDILDFWGESAVSAKSLVNVSSVG